MANGSACERTDRPHKDGEVVRNKTSPSPSCIAGHTVIILFVAPLNVNAFVSSVITFIAESSKGIRKCRKEN